MDIFALHRANDPQPVPIVPRNEVLARDVAGVNEVALLSAARDLGECPCECGRAAGSVDE